MTCDRPNKLNPISEVRNSLNIVWSDQFDCQDVLGSAIDSNFKSFCLLRSDGNQIPHDMAKVKIAHFGYNVDISRAEKLQKFDTNLLICLGESSGADQSGTAVADDFVSIEEVRSLLFTLF